jgi:hypothetical protein
MKEAEEHEKEELGVTVALDQELKELNERLERERAERQRRKIQSPSQYPSQPLSQYPSQPPFRPSFPFPAPSRVRD